jgi:hypothetical protein
MNAQVRPANPASHSGDEDCFRGALAAGAALNTKAALVDLKTPARHPSRQQIVGSLGITAQLSEFYSTGMGATAADEGRDVLGVSVLMS